MKDDEKTIALAEAIHNSGLTYEQKIQFRDFLAALVDNSSSEETPAEKNHTEFDEITEFF